MDEEKTINEQKEDSSEPNIPGEPADNNEADTQNEAVQNIQNDDEQNNQDEPNLNDEGNQNDQDGLNPNASDLPEEVQTQIDGVGDRFNENTVSAAVTTSDPERARKAREDENEYFDTLPLKADDNKENGDGAAEAGDKDLREKIQKLRKGNLYKAVLVGRLLEKNQKNPLANTVSGATSRFLDSSVVNSMSDLNTITGNAAGLLTPLSHDSGTTTFLQVTSLVTNLLTMVSTCRNMTIKLRSLYRLWKQHKAGEHASKIDAFLAVLGLASDTLLIMVKGVAIAKTIMTMAGKKNKIMNAISNAMFLLTGTTQIIGALNGIRGLQKGAQGLIGLHKAVKKPREEAMKVVERKVPGAKGETKSWSEQKRKNAAKELLFQKIYRKNNKNSENNENSENSENQTTTLTEEERDCLIMYLGISKRITKTERSLALTTTTLVNLTIGLVSTGVTGANVVVNKDKLNNEALKDATVGMGMVANGSNMIATSAKLAHKGLDLLDMSSRSKWGVMDGLWDKIMSLAKDSRGLKWLDHSLAKPPEERTQVEGKNPKEAAEETIALYNKTDNQFKALGVPYVRLHRASSKDKFERLLVDAL